jgi:hypothetical protein
MVIKVKDTASGATVKFPDDTDAHTINQVMTQHFATFQIKAPDGVYEVRAPDEKTALDAYYAHAQGAVTKQKPPSPGFIEGAVRSAATGVPVVGGLLNKADAATNAALSYALNPLFNEKDQLKGSIGERYDQALRTQQGLDQGFHEEHPIVDTAANLAGGAAAGVMIPGGAAGGIVRRVATNAASNAALGAADAATRGGDVGEGAIAGGLLGGGLTAAAPIVGAVASKPVSMLKGYFAPESAARGQIARGIVESGQTPAQIEAAVRQAAQEGQSVYNVADALGNAGQRMLSTVARANGEGRTMAVNALEGRQAGQGRRVANALAEGFDAPQTAAATRDAMTAARNDAADTAYDAIRAGSNPVDVVPAINHIDNIIGTGPGQALQTPNDAVEGILSGFRQRLARVNPDDFAAVQRIRGEMSDAAQNAAQNGYGNRARLIRGALGQLDSAMENASSGFRQANRNYAQATRDIEAIDRGAAAYRSGRPEDTIPAFQGLTPEGQRAYRTGYADRAIESVQGPASGVNKARQFTGDAFQDEAAAMAPGNDLMQRRLGRENTMHQTRNTALGGSKTADNLADQEAMAIDPTVAMGVIGNLLHGNVAGALHGLGHAGAAFLGNTPAVRAAVARYLLQNGATMAPGQLEAAINDTIRRIQRNARIATTLGKATRSAAVTTANKNQ